MSFLHARPWQDCVGANKFCDSDNLQADKGIFSAYNKVRGLLTSASEELLDVPLYYNLHTMCKSLRVTPPANSIIKSAIINAGQLPAKHGSCRLHSCTFTGYGE